MLQIGSVLRKNIQYGKYIWDGQHWYNHGCFCPTQKIIIKKGCAK
jgi:hypothetical protein